jgi:hypothetical protein
MKRQYRISPQGPDTPTDAEIARYRDPKRLLYNYDRAVRRPRRPLYRDPKAFIMLVLIVLLAIMLAERAEDRKRDHTAPPPERTAP